MPKGIPFTPKIREQIRAFVVANPTFSLRETAQIFGVGYHAVCSMRERIPEAVRLRIYAFALANPFISLRTISETFGICRHTVSLICKGLPRRLSPAHREQSARNGRTKRSNKLNVASVAAILFLRQKRRWTYAQLGAEFGVSKRMIERLFPGRVRQRLSWHLPSLEADKKTRQQIYRLIRLTQDRVFPKPKRVSPMLGRSWSTETRQKFSAARTGKRHSIETRRKMAKAQHVRRHVRPGITKAGCAFCEGVH